MNKEHAKLFTTEEKYEFLRKDIRGLCEQIADGKIGRDANSMESVRNFLLKMIED